MSNEKIILSGDFHIEIFKKGKKVESSTEKNLIVSLGRETVSKLLGGSGSARYVSKIAFGTNGTPAADGDTAITGAVTKAVASVSYPDMHSVAFSWTLEESEGNGLSIAEFGLVSNDLTLFSRKTRAIISKTSEIRMTGTWQINF